MKFENITPAVQAAILEQVGKWLVDEAAATVTDRRWTKDD